MSAMSELSIDLMHWDEMASSPTANYWARTLPNGKDVILGSESYGESWVYINGECEHYPTITEALRAVGAIAVEILDNEARTWAA